MSKPLHDDKKQRIRPPRKFYRNGIICYGRYRTLHMPGRTWMEGKFISYLRVSTQKQGVNGLGIDAQRKAIEGYLSGGP